MLFNDLEALKGEGVGAVVGGYDPPGPPRTYTHMAYLGSRVPGFLGPWILGVIWFLWVPGFMEGGVSEEFTWRTASSPQTPHPITYTRMLGSWVPGFMGSWVPGFLGSWVLGFMGSWVLGFLGSWVPEFLGSWVPGIRF